MKFLPIPKDSIESLWEHIEPILNKAVSLTPERIDTANVKQDALKGGYLLWIVYEEIKENQPVIIAVITTRLIEYPKTKALAMDFVAGSRMTEWLPIVMPILEDIAKTNHCTHLEAYGRRAWSKYLKDWDQRHIQYEKRIDYE